MTELTICSNCVLLERDLSEQVDWARRTYGLACEISWSVSPRLLLVTTSCESMVYETLVASKELVARIIVAAGEIKDDPSCSPESAGPWFGTIVYAKIMGDNTSSTCSETPSCMTSLISRSNVTMRLRSQVICKKMILRVLPTISESLPVEYPNTLYICIYTYIYTQYISNLKKNISHQMWFACALWLLKKYFIPEAIYSLTDCFKKYLTPNAVCVLVIIKYWHLCCQNIIYCIIWKLIFTSNW